MGNIGVNVGITKHLNANLKAFISGKRTWAESDRRDYSPVYAIVDLTRIVKEFFKGFNLLSAQK
jgi:hypothetical protein